jgi:ribonucrease Y
MHQFPLPYLFPALLISVIGGLFLGYLLRRYVAEVRIRRAEERAQEILEAAKEKASLEHRKASLKHKDLLHHMREDFDRETEGRKQQYKQLEKRLLQKEMNLDRRVELLDRKADEAAKREARVADREEEIGQKEKRIDSIRKEETETLHQLSKLSKEEAEKRVLNRIQQELKTEAETLVKRTLSEARAQAQMRARDIVVTAIERFTTDHTADSTVTQVPLPNDEMKARIIGKEGRNIRALEMATGVDIIVDDTPSMVIVSGFDPIRREVAKMTLERLVSDGRIHPSRIEEAVSYARRKLEEAILSEGEKAAFEIGIGELHPEITRLLGRLRYRSSYGQNVLEHSRETAYLMSVISSELGLDVMKAKRIGLLHDIGKAVSHELEGTHAQIGADLAKKYGEDPEVVEAIAAHHDDDSNENRSIFAVLAQACDALSAARPGARGENLEGYLKRLEKLEEIADSFEGVEKAYAIQAGREIRVIVQPDRIGDIEAHALARDLAKRVQKELRYPGQVKVVVIRETRAVDFAK